MKREEVIKWLSDDELIGELISRGYHVCSKESAKLMEEAVREKLKGYFDKPDEGTK